MVNYMEESGDYEAENISADLKDLEVLLQHRANCEDQGNYVDAEKFNTAAQDLRQSIKARQQSVLKKQQDAEFEGVRQARLAEEREFNEIWRRKQQEFKSHADNLRQTLEQRHIQDWEEKMAELKATTEPRTPRWSPKLLELRKVQERFARLKKYGDAASTKDEADRLEKDELEKWRKVRAAKIATLEAAFLKKQKLEMGGLMKRIESGMKEQENAKENEKRRLEQRFQNVVKQLSAQQNIMKENWTKYGCAFDSVVSRPVSRG